MKHMYNCVIAFCFAFLFVVSAAAEDKYDVYSDKDVAYGAETSFLTWHGYLSFEFINEFNDAAVSMFDNHEFYLSAKSVLSDRVGVTAEFEYEHAPEKLILPMQAYGDLKVTKFLTFRMGTFFSPIGIPRTYNLRGNKNKMIRQVALTHDILFENWAETGVNLFGEFDFGLFYDFAVGNGMPETMSAGDSWFDAYQDLQNHTEDNNDNKAIHLRAGYHKKNLMNGDINYGVSYGTQKYDKSNLREMNFIGADLRYLHQNGFRIQAEYLQRDGDDDSLTLATKGIAAKAIGWYGQISKRFTFKDNSWLNYVEPAVQIDLIDLNTNVDNNKDKLTTALAFIYSPEQNYSLKFEYDIVKEQTEPLIDNNKLFAAMVVEF